MNSRKNSLMILGLVLSVSLLSSALAATLVFRGCSRGQFALLGDVCAGILEREPEAREAVSAALKAHTDGAAKRAADANLLETMGYQSSDFSVLPDRQKEMSAAAGFLAGILLLFVVFLYRRRMENERIRSLAGYLERANAGEARILSASGEDEFSKLEDEIYKTVTHLYQTKENALRARDQFADHLSNIAHQLKTPITAISLDAQRMEKDKDQNHLRRIREQLFRLTRLEEALLTVSRLDAGALKLQNEQIDVFTVLHLAADNLQELQSAVGAGITIRGGEEAAIAGDLEWTMEALMNLMKNCLEYGGKEGVFCSYAQNPLYTEIQIWDEGEGFSKADLPHLFERFYRGRNAGKNGVGIGLALSKEIIERQNGTIRARNRPEGGACFEIRFYCH